jgi:transforming growth factor-beta-induced protein
MRKLFGVLVAAVALMAFSLPVFAQDDVPTIAEIVVASATGETPEFTALLAAVQAADPAVLEALSNPEAELTVFAPTDAAFAALGEETLNAVLADQAMLTDILLFHVINGMVMSADVAAALEGGAFSTATLQGQYIDVAQTPMGITINGANLVTVDITASNGVIHVIDAVILPESRTIAEIVVDLASAEEGAEFTALLAAVQAADPAVLEALSDPEAELTVFAPTDAAFAALGEETLTAVLGDAELISSILLYHVVAGVIHDDVLGGLLAEADMMTLEVPTINGAPVTFTANEDGVFINDAQIILTNVDAANGVIHVIDAVILPPM